MSFQVSALPKCKFQQFFSMSDEELADHGAVRQTVNKKPGAPCRISLQDAEIGEEVLLVHYEHQTADTPFKASHAVYVRPAAEQAQPEAGEVPEVLRSRTISLRGFDAAGMMVQADLAEGRGLETAIGRMFAATDVQYLHLHYAKPGCYAARVDRV